MSSEYSNHQDFLLALCKWQALGGEKPRLSDMGTRWGDLLRDATAQKVERILARYFATPPGENAMPYRLAMDMIESARIRSEASASAVRELQAELSQAGITSLARKGVVYGTLFYGDWAFRSQVDNDLFVLPKDREATFEFLKRKGYFVGNWSPASLKMEPLARRSLFLYDLHPDHLPHLSRHSTAPFCHVVRFDVALMISWYGAPYPGIEEALTNAYESTVEVAGIRTIANRLHFLDCLLHTFREGYHENAIRDGMDVNLRKFLDIWLIWLNLDDEDRELVRRDIKEFHLHEVAGWVASHLDFLFETDLIEGLGLKGIWNSEYGNTWKNASGEIRTWSGTMRDRLFAQDRLILFDQLSTAPET